MTQEGLYLAKDGLGHLDGTWPALGLTQLTQGGQVVHSMGKRLIVPVHQAQALQEDRNGSYNPSTQEVKVRGLPNSRLVWATKYNSNRKFKNHFFSKELNVVSEPYHLPRHNGPSAFLWCRHSLPSNIPED